MDETSAAVDALIADLAEDRPDAPAGALPGVWSTMVDLGLSTVGIDEEAGGSGGTYRTRSTLLGRWGGTRSVHR